MARKTERPGWKARDWIRLRRAVQYLVLAAFVATLLGAHHAWWPSALVDLPLQLDPLTSLANALAARVLLAGSLIALLTVVLTLAFGRAWCGWLCPLGTTLDLLAPRRARRKPFSRGEGWRKAKYLLVVGILVAALLGNLTLLVLDPLTLTIRTFSASIWPAVDQVVTATEAGLYSVPPLQPLLGWLDALLRPRLLPATPAYYRYGLLLAALFAGIIGLNWVAERFWCRYLCPLGGLLGLMSKVAIVRRDVTMECDECGACARVCPTGTIRPDEGYASDPGECTMCLECLAGCPRSGVAFRSDVSIAPWKEYDPSRRDVLVGLGAAVVGVGLLHSEAVARRDPSYLIRPPGARENNLLAKCIRCGECSRACPTGGIQPALAESGAEGLFTPVLVPRLGYCDYACNACGQVCPVDAIPPLGLEQKRQQVLGLAYIDQNRCIAWADNRDCIVCEEMCPVPDKAIKLEVPGETGAGGSAGAVKRPRVVRDQCIGCGICEYKCPVNGEAAIRVFVPNAPQPF